MDSTQSQPVDPLGIYLHGVKSPLIPITVAEAEGPYLILIFLLILLSGINLTLYAIYTHLFGGRRGDRPLLQIAVFISVACNVILAFYGSTTYYHSDFFLLFSEPGLNVNKIESYVVLFHTLQAIPEAIGQVYFALRIGKLFDHRKVLTRIGVAVALAGICGQFVLMTWFGAAFYSIGTKSKLSTARWVKDILAAWCILFITLEVSMTCITVVRLLVLRRQTSMGEARKVIFRLAAYSLYGQFLLTAYSLISLGLFLHSTSGWYMPMYLLNGALYTLVLLANLIHRSVVASAMKEVQQNYTNTQRRQDATSETAFKVVPHGARAKEHLVDSSSATSTRGGVTSHGDKEVPDEGWTKERCSPSSTRESH